MAEAGRRRGGRGRSAVRGLHRQGRHRGAVGPRRLPPGRPRRGGRHRPDRHPARRPHRHRRRADRHRRTTRDRTAGSSAADAPHRRRRTAHRVHRRPATATPSRPSRSTRRGRRVAVPVPGRAPAARRAPDSTRARSPGSGRDGRITRNDVLAAAANRRMPAPDATAVASRPDRRRLPAVAGPDDDVVGFTKARRTTAANMLRSLAHVRAHAGRHRGRLLRRRSSSASGRPDVPALCRPRRDRRASASTPR